MRKAEGQRKRWEILKIENKRLEKERDPRVVERGQPKEGVDKSKSSKRVLKSEPLEKERDPRG